MAFYSAFFEIMILQMLSGADILSDVAIFNYISAGGFHLAV